MIDGLGPIVGDLLQINRHLVVSCGRCRRTVRWSAAQAVERLGFGAAMVAVAGRLKCAACGASGRDKWLTAVPCTLDQAAWDARYDLAQGRGRGLDPEARLAETLATLARLAGGELGGDGPVQWPVDQASKDA